MTEFLLHGLYDPDRHSEEEARRFIGNSLHWPIAHTCNPTSWQATTEDKVLAATILQAGGVPVAPCLGVIDRSARTFPGMPKISDAASLRAFCLAHVEGGLFAKIVGGMVGFGTLRIEAADDTTITCSNHGVMTYESFLSDLVGENSYLVQRTLRNHSAIAPYASALSTVRMVNLVRDTDIVVPMAALALAQGDNIADAFWRDGNLACAVDVQTGRLTTVARRDEHEIVYLDDHPSVAGLKGLVLPWWDELVAINERAARLFAPIRYQSTDIAITEYGPMIVEINYGSGFGLPQQAAGRGMLTPEVRAFFESCGYRFGKPEKRRFRLFRSH